MPRELTAEQVYQEVMRAASTLDRVCFAVAWFDETDPRLPLMVQATRTVDELAREVRRLGARPEAATR